MKARIRLFKIIDPIFQSLLFMVFTYAIYSVPPYELSYRVPFVILMLWQLFSALAHLSFKRVTKLKQQRKYHLSVFSVFLLIYFIYSVFIPEKFVEDRVPDGTVQIPLYSMVLAAIGLGVCFWYSIICFREIRRILNKAQHLDN